MWARRCGAAPQWPSRVKVVLQSIMVAAVGYAVYEYMSGADMGYLDLTKPKTDEVLCLSGWPERHAVADWWMPAYWDASLSYRGDMDAFIEKRQCASTRMSMRVRNLGSNLTVPTCGEVMVRLAEMSNDLRVPLGRNMGYDWKNDVLEVYASLFYALTVWLWVFIAVHDLALLSVTHRDHVLDLRGIRNKFGCVRYLYTLIGFRYWKRMLRKNGLRCGKKICLKRLSFVLAWMLLPVYIAWVFIVFFIVVLPVVTLFFIAYPISLSRALVFINANISGVVGVVVTIHSLVFLANPGLRQLYAVTWEDQSCTCGCNYPVKSSTFAVLVGIGVASSYKAFVLAFRCLKGLRRANWTSLLSVMFPVPLTVYEVFWTQPDGTPIQWRKDGDPVQGELAFDPFAMMDEQPESAMTTLHLFPSFVEKTDDPLTWTTEDVISYFTRLELTQYCEAIASKSVDGPMLLELLRADGLNELGITSKLHASKVRCRITTAPVIRSIDNRSKAFQHESRIYRGPTLRRSQMAAPELESKEYLGCCGFPCIKGETRSRWKMDETEKALESAGSSGGLGSEPRIVGATQEGHDQLSPKYSLTESV